MNFELNKHKNDLLFVALGGANEIGMNLNLYHLNGKWLMVDLGVGFGYNLPGIDMITPDISFIKGLKKNLIAIILTHIHEDHMGAVQYLWPELEAPVYASNLGANFLRSKLSEYKLEDRVKINILDNRRELDLDPFKIELIGLTHSVPEMKALIIKTSEGNVLHTGDWKFDPDPVVGEVSEKEKIASYGAKDEILAVVCDSTNALNPGHSRSEGDLYHSLKQLIMDANGLVAVTTFASNIARVHTIMKIAKEVGRKVMLAGFSLHRIFEIGKKSGYFSEEFQVISDRDIKLYSKNEVLVIATGCQGEPMAAMKKVATNTHPTLHFGPTDLVIFSSKIIPGNEKKIAELFNLFAKKQVHVITEKDHFVHVSGHPSELELREMYQLANPAIAIPVHGEFLHTQRHGEIASDCGVKKVIQVENGSVVKLSKNLGEAKVVGTVTAGYYGVDGYQLINLKSEKIRERYKLQFAGAIVASIALDPDFKITGMKINSLGAYDLVDDPSTLRSIEKEIAAIIYGKLKESGAQNRPKFFKKRSLPRTNFAELEKTVKSRLAKIFEQLMGKKPLVDVTIHYPER